MDSRFSPAAVTAFELAFRPWMRRRLHAVYLTGLCADRLPADRPLLLAANHTSWWDGFLLREVQRALRPRAPMYTLMGEAELSRLPWFRLLGVLGIDGGSAGSIAGAIRTLERRVAARPDLVVGYFPQGRIWPSYRRPLGFRRGVELFARRLDALVLPVALHLEPLTTVAPTAFASVGEPVEGSASVEELEHRVEAELDAILGFLVTHGEAAPSVWPASHGRLTARLPLMPGAR